MSTQARARAEPERAILTISAISLQSADRGGRLAWLPLKESNRPMRAPGFVLAFRRHRTKVVDDQIDEVERALGVLGYSWIALPLHIRVALREHRWWDTRATVQKICRIALAYHGVVYITALLRNEPWQPGAVFGWLFFFFPIYGIILTFRAPRQRRRYMLVAACIAAIRACAEARTEGSVQRSWLLQAVSSEVASVERAIFRARRAHLRVARGRHARQVGLRQHAERVVAALRAAEARLDVDRQDAALEALSGLLIGIASSAATGRIGALLPESITSRYRDVRVRDWEVLRTAAVAVVITAAAIGVGLLGLGDVAAWAVIAGVFVLVSLLAFGSEWRRLIHVLDIFRA